MMHGGIPAGNCFILEGPAGNERDLIAVQFVKKGLESGEAVLVVLSNMSPDDYRRLLSFSGIDTEPYEKSGALRFLDWYSHRHQEIKGIEYNTGRHGSVVKVSLDLANLGIALSKCLEEMTKWDVRRGVFEILSQAITTFGLRTAYNFAQTTRAKCRDHDVTGIFILDSEAHTPREKSTLHQAFDGLVVVEREREGKRVRREICVLAMTGTPIRSEYMELLVEGNTISVKGEFVEVEVEVKPEDDLLADLDGVFEGFLEEELATAPAAKSADVRKKTARREKPAEAGATVHKESEKIMEELLVPEKAGPGIVKDQDMMACPDCGALMHEDETKCPSCGAEFEEGEEEVGLECPKCGNLVGEDDEKCASCGEVFEEELREVAPVRKPSPGDDERVTDILGDLEPYMESGYDLSWLVDLVRKDQSAGAKEVLVFISRAKEISALEKIVAGTDDPKLKKMLKKLKTSACSPLKDKRAGVEWGILELRSLLRTTRK
jgi:KaiC/GvpD/RAD55 family RecA-like ATPase/RNA polymerase subunit RPABC4/transcription elongation factor Spt4